MQNDPQSVECIHAKANSRIFMLKKLASYGIAAADRLKIYCSCIQPLLLYACEAWYGFLTKSLKADMERIQNYALKLIFSNCDTYCDRLSCANILSIENEYHQRCKKLFMDILSSPAGSLHQIALTFINRDRRSTRSHSTSLYRYRTRTEFYRK